MSVTPNSDKIVSAIDLLLHLYPAPQESGWQTDNQHVSACVSCHVFFCCKIHAPDVARNSNCLLLLQTQPNSAIKSVAGGLAKS